MEIFIDTADIKEIKSASQLSILDGVTTNPTILSKQKLPPREVLVEINSLVRGKVWYQVTSEKAGDMVDEAKEMISVINRPVIKLPMGVEALNACHILSKEGIETNMTLVFSVSQAILAAKAGASYVSPYVGRINDTGWSGYQLIREIVSVYEKQQFNTKVIGASLRGSYDIVEMAMLGAKAVTMPYKIFSELIRHPMTDIGRTQFDNDWQGLQDHLKNM
ncbi:transaldolase family protein [Peribacillus glennii]|uniref:Fructose-6-phosphate aldolase n=1 Tax=Peribacillus glennii TaxID=2303991 RepID=A0A372L8Q3_9BACI|nr:transaldolase family protein [Peribacillus glennii]RFU61808.1 fructose-6-phosphate aldolase [Peribacillus glennii]